MEIPSKARLLRGASSVIISPPEMWEEQVFQQRTVFIRHVHGDPQQSSNCHPLIEVLRYHECNYIGTENKNQKFQTLKEDKGMVKCCLYAAAAKSLQSCLTLCDPIDGSPPGSSVPGILQARTLEWVAISFSSYMLLMMF